MKKVSITILLILPFILIYFISFLGKVINRYGHIAAESISVYVQEGTEWVASKEGAIFKYDMDVLGSEPMPFNIQVRPTEANNRAFTVFNTNEKVSHIDVNEDNEAYLTLLSRGMSHYTVASAENPKITYSFYVQVEQGDLKKIEFFNKKNPSQTFANNEVYLPLGRSKEIGLQYVPRTAREEFKNLTWTFSQELDFAAPIRFEEGSRRITGINTGDIVATVTSNEINKDGVYVSASLTIHVVERSEEKAYFNFFEVDKALKLDTNSIDFKSEGGETTDIENKGKILFNDSGLTYDDVFIRVGGGQGNVDQSQISNLIISFIKTGTATIELYLKSEPNIVLDKITIMAII